MCQNLERPDACQLTARNQLLIIVIGQVDGVITVRQATFLLGSRALVVAYSLSFYMTERGSAFRPNAKKYRETRAGSV